MSAKFDEGKFDIDRFDIIIDEIFKIASSLYILNINKTDLTIINKNKSLITLRRYDE